MLFEVFWSLGMARDGELLAAALASGQRAHAGPGSRSSLAGVAAAWAMHAAGHFQDAWMRRVAGTPQKCTQPACMVGSVAQERSTLGAF